MAIKTRRGENRPLTHDELDDNFEEITNLNIKNDNGVIRDNDGNNIIPLYKTVLRSYQASPDVTTESIMRASHSYWGNGVIKVEIYKDYFDGANTDYSMVLARLNTHYDQNPSVNILTKIDGEIKPYWSDIFYPDGEVDGSIGYADLKVDIPAYKNIKIAITMISLPDQNSKEEVRGGGRY